MTAEKTEDSVPSFTKTELAQVSAYLEGAVILEGLVMEAGKAIREKSKAAYGRKFTDVRLLSMALLVRALTCKSGIPGIANEATSAQLGVIAAFAQGTCFTESLISEGQYVKGAAALKQDYEMLARVREIEIGKAKVGRQPQVQHAPSGTQFFYGELNKVAHPSNPEILQRCMGGYISDTINAANPIPIFVEQSALGMYELHIWICFEMAREAVKLLTKMYRKDDPDVLDCLQKCVALFPLLEAAGFKSH